MDATSSVLSSQVLAHLLHAGLVREGHFQYLTGRHSGVNLDQDRLLADPQAASRMGYALAKAFYTDRIDTVVAPSPWGAPLAQWVAYFLQPRAWAVCARPASNGTSEIATSLLDLIACKRVLLVDNVISNSESLLSFGTHVQSIGGKVLGIGALWIEDALPNDRGVAVGLLNDRYPSYPPEACPLCKDGHDTIETIPY